ncbi:hypothetical protein FTW19_24595 [Terriglobus albidus]|uniref:Uncharacterized protein n=1 Tax=Terriglobus albidus TaxID=1592106 RepID=A0A5B9EFT1_9BACT|nr:hypothetical protein FTW19_24595 [Terriglobus albidus]
MRREYDFGKGIRGKYAVRGALGTNLVLLKPNVSWVSRDSTAINNTLRVLIKTLTQPEKEKSI